MCTELNEEIYFFRRCQEPYKMKGKDLKDLEARNCITQWVEKIPLVV